MRARSARRILRTGGAALAVLVVVNVGLLVYMGLYDFAATRQHPQPVYQAIAVLRDWSVARQADAIAPPEGFRPVATAEGARLYAQNCLMCHGAPGVAPADFALGLNPLPPSIVSAARRRPPEEIYWLVRNGIRMAGMPAALLRLSEPEMWAVTAFVESLPAVAPADYADLMGGLAGAGADGPQPSEAPAGRRVASPERGRLALQLYGCRSCHSVPGLVGAERHVGPPLGGAGERRYIAGVLQNTPENMVRWIMAPQEVDPLSAMPDLGVPREDARDIAAFLYSLSGEEEPVAVVAGDEAR